MINPQAMRALDWLNLRLVRVGALLPLLALCCVMARHRLVAPEKLSDVEDVAEVEEIDADVLKIDGVLRVRAPQLGLEIRRRVAVAITEEADRARFDPLFVLALIDVESDFAQDAVSYAGARGLMQLRPQTLEYIAGKEGVKLTATEIYRDPAMQVRLGIRYLSTLEKRFGNLNLALMAYNAGPERIRQSLIEGDIERFKGYVGLVRRNFALFRRGEQLAQDAALAQASPPVDAPEPPAQP